jgi:nucleotide-binding universal stress UspA family protein
MQKIMLLVDPKGVNKAAHGFASYLSTSGSIKLYGLFLQQGAVPVEESKKAFLDYHKNLGSRMAAETVDAFTKEQIIEETRFADAIIISAETSFNGSPQSVPSALAEFILKKSECPVIVAPTSADPVREVVFAYDGSASSVFAVREFTRVFPQFEDARVTFLEVAMDDSGAITNQKKITDYLKLHYSSIGYRVLHGKPEDELFSYFLEKKNTFLVLGAFGRSPVSSFIHRSAASLLLKTTTLPLFITHR